MVAHRLMSAAQSSGTLLARLIGRAISCEIRDTRLLQCEKVFPTHSSQMRAFNASKHCKQMRRFSSGIIPSSKKASRFGTGGMNRSTIVSSAGVWEVSTALRRVCVMVILYRRGADLIMTTPMYLLEGSGGSPAWVQTALSEVNAPIAEATSRGSTLS